MRALTYTILILVAALILVDTNLGHPVPADQRALVSAAAENLAAKDLRQDSGTLKSMLTSDGFRRSLIFDNVSDMLSRRGTDYSFYAFTPTLSRTRIFLGSSFMEIGITGRSSIMIHELAHLHRHKTHPLRGFPRNADEAQAYLRQYATHRKIGLQSVGDDGLVYWDMMIGIQKYVLPIYPEYAREPDIQAALEILEAGLNR